MISATFQKRRKWFGKDIKLSRNQNLTRNYSTNKSVLKIPMQLKHRILISVFDFGNERFNSTPWTGWLEFAFC